jgi:hypothetical protein
MGACHPSRLREAPLLLRDDGVEVGDAREDGIGARLALVERAQNVARLGLERRVNVSALLLRRLEPRLVRRKERAELVGRVGRGAHE